MCRATVVIISSSNEQKKRRVNRKYVPLIRICAMQLFLCFISFRTLHGFQGQCLQQQHHHHHPPRPLHRGLGGVKPSLIVTLHQSTTTILDEEHYSDLSFISGSSSSRWKRPRRIHRTKKCRCYDRWMGATTTCRHMKQNLSDENDSNDDSFLNWLTSSSSSSSKGTGDSTATPKKSAMVQPIGYDGQPLNTSKQQPEANRIRPNFGNLFQGMPSLNDIMGSSSTSTSDATSIETGDKNEEDDDDDDDDDSNDPYINSSNTNKNNIMGRPRRRRFSTEEVDETWFEKERLQIKSKFDTILRDMLEQIQSERKHDPESVPSNAEELMKSVLKQEMEIEMKDMKQQRNEERYMTYDESTRQKESENIDTSNYISPNPNIQRLMDESEAEYVKQSTSRNELQDFLLYQSQKQEEQSKLYNDDSKELSPQLPSINENLDQWALDRLKDMANSRKDTDADEMILDILQDNVNQLENNIRKENDKLSKFITNQPPQTMKEWQMYRAIASRMDKNPASNTTSTNTNKISDRDDLIMQQLQLWKEYIVKEEGNRKQSGLARGPKLPFAWQESVLGTQKNNRYDDESLSPLTNDKARRIETRKTVNRMSMEAMESLLLKTDPTRRDKLQKEIDYLKATLEANDYLDIDESTFDDYDNMLQRQQMLQDGSVDTTNLFTSLEGSSDDDNDLDAWDTSSSSSQVNTDTFTTEAIQGTIAAPYDNNIDNVVVSSTRPIPPPRTAFFSDVMEEDGAYDLGETFTGDSKLGTMEEQKLEAMFRRAGAKTPEERKVIQTQWEEFQQLEKNKRQQSGLSDNGDSSAVESTDALKYNIADVMREDGDFDAATILATIGPRPVRKKKDTSVSVENDNHNDIPMSTTIKQEDVIDSLFRSVSAVGGGRFKDDPVAKQQERSSFEEFVLKESRMRESLDDPSLASRTTLDDLQLPEPTDDTNYAKEVLSSIGPRPSRASKRTPPMNAREYSDRGGVLASETDDDDEDDDDEDDDAYETTSASKNGEFDLVPEWLRKENEEAKKGTAIANTLSGNEIDVVFDNDKYEHNMRQLAEYEKRRKGQSRSMGIDISDVLGRRDSDDYADFKYDDDFLRSRQNDGWSYGTFSNRKANLLDYIELDVQEINSLMDHKDSVYSTGVSQYLPRINKPFKEFGAIFRLEGVIVDVDGLQIKAWTKVAEEFGLKRPTIDDVKLAAVTRPEAAVKDIFAWTDDFLECRNIAAAHRRTFKQVFQTWTKDAGITVPVSAVEESNQQSYIGNRQIEAQRVDSRTSESEGEMLHRTGKAWSTTASEYGKVPPDDTAVLIASTLSPDIAVLKVFKWSTDPLEIERIARSYRLNLLPEAERQAVIKNETIKSVKKASAKKPQTQAEVMELHYKAWSDISQKYGFNPPATDEVLAAFVINEPEVAARGFGWSDDPKILSDIAKDFLAKLNTYQSGLVTPQPTVSNVSSTPSNEKSDTNNSIREELFQIAFDAWSETARSHSFPAPDTDQVQFALSVGPEEAIVTGFEWTTNPAEIVKLLRSYRDAVGRIRGAEYKKPMEIPKPIQTPSGPSQDDIYRTVFDSWTALAKELGHPLPDDEQVQFALSVGAEEAIMNGFGWTKEPAKVAELLGKYKAEIATRRSLWQNYLSAKPQSKNDHDDIPMYKVTPGVSRWIKSLLDVEMQCSVVSYLEREQVDTLLELAGLSDLIPPDKRISASNGYVTDTDVLLGAALRVERRPDHCVVFDTTPYSSVAAHEVEMQSVCLIGPYPRYELLSADTTTASFDTLSAINIRRLFSERVYDQPMVEVQTADPVRTRPTKTRTRFYDDE